MRICPGCDITLLIRFRADARSAMVVIQWKQRPKELQEKVAKALADLLLAEGSRPVEIIYQNLDMDDFYEYKGE